MKRMHTNLLKKRKAKKESSKVLTADDKVTKSAPTKQEETLAPSIEPATESHQVDPESVSKWRAIFNQYDVDSDGTIGIYELCAAFVADGQSKSHVWDVLKTYDDDKDGRISFEEFLRWNLQTNAVDLEANEQEKSLVFSIEAEVDDAYEEDADYSNYQVIIFRHHFAFSFCLV